MTKALYNLMITDIIKHLAPKARLSGQPTIKRALNIVDIQVQKRLYSFYEDTQSFLQTILSNSDNKRLLKKLLKEILKQHNYLELSDPNTILRLYKKLFGAAQASSETIRDKVRRTINLALLLDLLDREHYFKSHALSLTPLGYLLLQRNFSRNFIKKAFTRPGTPLICRDNGVQDLFEHPDVKTYHEYLANHWIPANKPIALYLPCSARKPYRGSIVHAKTRAAIRKAKLTKYVEIYVISEPMTLVPIKYEHWYPFAHYDYPPSDMTPEEINKLINLLITSLAKAFKKHQWHIAFLPSHHKKVLESAAKLLGFRNHLLEIPYNIYFIKELIKVLCTARKEYRRIAVND